MTFREKLESGQFVYTAEVNPPKGTNIGKVLDDAEQYLKGVVDAVNATDCAGANVRAGSLVTCHLLKQRGMEPILQVSCRDRNRIALQSDLLSAGILGIRNVLVVTGDHPHLGDHPQAKPVFDLDSVTVLEAVAHMLEGKDMNGNPLDGAPNFFMGAVVTPSHPIPELQIMKMEKKVRAGAKFFQTQAVFDVEKFAEFSAQVKHLHVPILAGVIMLKSERMATFLNEKVSGISIPPSIIDRIKNAENKAAESIALTAELVRGLKPYCQGIHFMTLGWERHIRAVLSQVNESMRLCH